MAYVQQNFTDGASIACITATASLCVSLIVFSCGRRMYLVHHPRIELVFTISHNYDHLIVSCFYFV